jgi:hypothetical protein
MFIIEHPTRGTLRVLEAEFDGEIKARFSLTGARNDPNKTLLLPLLSDAVRMREKIPTPIRYDCKILTYCDYDKRYYVCSPVRV